MNVILIGMMGSGKTTVGERLAEKLFWRFFDSDRVLENEQKTTIEAIFETKGEPFFRQIEKDLMKRLGKVDRAIIATGGGAACQEDNWNAWRQNGKTVWLQARPETIHQRIRPQSGPVRPLLKGNLLAIEKISEILKSREDFYRRADLALEMDQMAPDEAADKIIQAFGIKT